MNKRKHTSVPLEMKLHALMQIDQGVPLRKVASDLGVSHVTVGDWKRNRAKLEYWMSERLSSSDPHSPSLRMKSSDFPKTSQALFIWYCDQRRKGHSVSGPNLQERAIYFNSRLKEGETFTASSGWLDRWKKRNNIKLSVNCQELESFNQYQHWLLNDTEIDDEMIINMVTMEPSFEKYIPKIINMPNLPEPAPSEPILPDISHAEGFRRLEEALEYVKQQPEAKKADLNFFDKWCLIAARKQNNELKEENSKKPKLDLNFKTSNEDLSTDEQNGQKEDYLNFKASNEELSKDEQNDQKEDYHSNCDKIEVED